MAFLRNVPLPRSMQTSYRPCMFAKPIQPRIHTKAALVSHSNFHPQAAPVKNSTAQRVPAAHPPVRFFATDKDILGAFKKSEVRRISVAEPRANELIVAIQKGDYVEARKLVVKEKVNVDGHTKNENTALADAAKRGDTKAVKFLLKDLKANPSASCDCPAHQTALHYAAKGGHTETVKVLLEYGAKPNVLDSWGQSAIDVAKTQEVRVILKAHEEEALKQLGNGEMPLRKYLPK